MLTKGAIGNLVNKYRAVLKKCGLLNIFGSLALAGALTVGAAGMTGAVPYDQMGNFTAGTSYDSTSGGASDTVVVTKADGAITGTGTVTIDAAKGLEINAVSGAGKLSVGDSQDMTVNNGLKLAAGSVITTNDATLEINGTDAAVNMMVPAGEMIGSATITGSVAEGGAGLATINVTKGTLGAYTTDGKLAGMTISGPVAVTVTATDGKLVAGALKLSEEATLTNANDVTIDGIGSDDGAKMALMRIEKGSTYTGNLTLNDAVTNPLLFSLDVDASTLDGDLTVANGNARLAKASVTGDVIATGGNLDVYISKEETDTTSLKSLTINGGNVEVHAGTLDVTNALTLGDTRGSEFTLANGAKLTADSLASGESNNGGVMWLKGEAEIAAASELKSGAIFVQQGATTFTDKLTLSGGENMPGAALTVSQGGTLTTSDVDLTKSGSLEVKQGGTLVLAQNKTITVGGSVPGSSRTEADGSLSLYGTDAFGAGKIEGKVDVSTGMLAFNSAVDLTSLLVDGTSSQDGKIVISGAGTVRAYQGLTFTGDSLALGDAGSTLQGGDLTLGTTDFTMTKGTLESHGGVTIFDGYTPIDCTAGLTVGDGTGTLTLTANSSLNLTQVATRTSTVAAGKIDVAAGTMNVQRGAWQMANLTVGTNGTLTVGGTPATTGQADLTVTGAFDTKTGGGSADIVNGTLALDGTVATATDNLNIGDLGQVVTDLNTAYNVNRQSLADGFGTVKGSGLLTLRNDTGTTEMSLADYKTMTTALQGNNGKLVGIAVDNLNITGIEGATLDSAPTSGQTNAAGLTGLEDVVASVSDPTVSLDGNRTDLKGLSVADSGTVITVGTGTTTVLTLKGDATDREFDLDAGGTADLVVDNGSILNLGTVAGDKTYGDLSGDITLSSASDVLNVVNGDFSTGDITVGSPNAGTVNAIDAVLNAGVIGVVGTEVGTVNANNGILNADSIATKALTADNGTVRAEGDITVTNAMDGTTGSLTNGTIHSATGDVTLTAGASNASGAIVADTGDITASGKDITAAADEDLTLSAEKGTIAAQNVTATDVRAKTLTTSGAVTVTDGVLVATGESTDKSTITGTLGLTNSQTQVGDLDVTGAATIEGGSFTGGDVTLSGGGEISNGAQVSVDSLSGASGQVIAVGSTNDDKASSVTANELALNGGKLVIDPDWTADGPNHVAIGGMAGANIDGGIGVGQNSMLTIGTRDMSWLAGQVDALGGLNQNGITAALGLKEAQVLGDSAGTGYSLIVDGSKDNAALTTDLSTANKADFAADSLLVVSADAALDPAGALSATTATATTVAASAKLRIAGAEVGETYTILGSNMNDANLTITGDGWTNANFSTDSLMVAGGAFDAATGTIKTSLNSARNVLPSLDNELADVLDAGYLNHEIGTADKYVNADAKGVRFLSRATSRDYIGGDARQAAVTIESAARMALAGAVPQMTMAAGNAAGNAVTQRTGLARPGGNAIQSMGTDGSMQTGASAGDAAKTGFAMWIMPLYQSSNGFGMKAGNFDMDFSGGLGGVAIGADYTFDNAIRAGITFNIGGGYAQGSGDLNETTNNMNFWGIGAYAGWTPGNFGLTADVNYTSTYNKLEQDLPASMQMGKLKSDVTAYAISAGLRGEYRFETSVMDVTPHVGVRYMSLNTDEYDVKSGGTVLKGDAINQSIWTFPVGVAFSKQIETGNGWHFKPSLDLAVIPAAGDIDARSDVRFTGTGTKAELDTQTMDYVSYMGQAGLEFGNDTTTLGVNYNIQLGAKSTAHGVFGTFRYEF